MTMSDTPQVDCRVCGDTHDAPACNRAEIERDAAKLLREIAEGR
jgi:hypothetical protein